MKTTHSRSFGKLTAVTAMLSAIFVATDAPFALSPRTSQMLR